MLANVWERQFIIKSDILQDKQYNLYYYSLYYIPVLSLVKSLQIIMRFSAQAKYISYLTRSNFELDKYDIYLSRSNFDLDKEMSYLSCPYGARVFGVRNLSLRLLPVLIRICIADFSWGMK